MKRFVVGDIAIFAVVNVENLLKYRGELCVISVLYPDDFKAQLWRTVFDDGPDYVITMLSDGYEIYTMDYTLNKLPPREEPESMAKREECEA